MKLISILELGFYGGSADKHLIDPYEYARSLEGISRTIKIIGHYYLEEEIIYRAPSSILELYVSPPEEGSIKTQIYVGVLSSLLAAPLGLILTRELDYWLPEKSFSEQFFDPTKDDKKIYDELSKNQSQPTVPTENIINADVYRNRNRKELDTIRSICANSFRETFRPISRGVSAAQISDPNHHAPTKPILPATVATLESDVVEEKIHTISGTVVSFSRKPKIGYVLSQKLGMGFRIEYRGKEDKLPTRDIFSWSQYEQKDIIMEGQFVRYFDGRIKKMIVYYAGHPTA